tara:strand:- start:1164 stop:2210 length:1047 start_codon:yes stop_codon:yes gene_type:complete
MQTFELLDRLELLYADNGNLSDLRRVYIDNDLSSLFRLTDGDEELRKAVIEKNMHSIFRLIEGNVTGDIEDLRKAVVEQNLHSLFRLIQGNDDIRSAVTEENLHSIFRLVDDEDLRKLILEDNTWKLWPILDRYVDTQFVAAFKNFFVNETEIWNDCFSRGQIESKLWLVKELTKLNLDLGTVFLCAGWYATLATMLFESNVKVDKIRSFDIDPSCVDIAEVFNKQWFINQWHFKSITQDIMDINYNEHTWQQWSNANNRMSYPITDVPDTIINTSCEHIPNFTEWYAKIPAGKLVILQSNNFFEVDEHVNCSIDIDDFSRQTPLTSVLYSDSLQLEKYTRYMRIGYK